MLWQCVLFWVSALHGIFPGTVLERVARDLGPGSVGLRPDLGGAAERCLGATRELLPGAATSSLKWLALTSALWCRLWVSGWCQGCS